jgi:flagellar biosynthesis/type III secretory pathway chaperone
MRDPDRAAERLIALLKAERQALRRGRLDEVAAMAGEKAMLVERVERNRPRPQTVRRIAQMAADSLRQLDAALRGIRAARARITSLAAPPSLMPSYDGQGRAQPIGTADSAVERRA